MRVSIMGAGNVGRSVARELLANGHEVQLIEKNPAAIKVDSVPDADWVLADGCEVQALDELAHLDECDVAIAATGDDKANLVHSLLAKTEFSVPRTIGRVNHPSNEWMFDDVWGVDVPVSMPRLMSSIVEEAVAVGDVVHLYHANRGTTSLVEITPANDSPRLGSTLGTLALPGDFVLVAHIRDGRASAPREDLTIEAGDKLLFVGDLANDRALADYFSAGSAASEPRVEG